MADTSRVRLGSLRSSSLCSLNLNLPNRPHSGFAAWDSLPVIWRSTAKLIRAQSESRVALSRHHNYWTPNDIAAAFSHYWASTATANDKNTLIDVRPFLESNVTEMRNRQPNELQHHAPFLVWEYHWLIQWPFEVIIISSLPAILIPQSSCIRTSFTESRIIFFKTRSHFD